jgi:hypothetical protein
MATWEELYHCTDAELARVDPLEMNLAVAKAIPCFARLDISSYKKLVDQWTMKVANCIEDFEPEFFRTPEDWKNDIHFFRLGLVCHFIDCTLGVTYREDQKDLGSVFSTPTICF